MAREWLLFVQESAFGVPVTPGVVWPIGSASAFYGRLDGGDSFTMRPRPVMVTGPYGGGVNVPAYTVADKIICKGRYTTKLYAGPFSQFLLNWGGQPVNTAKTFPWTTTEIAGNLASVSIYHVIQRSDGTYKSRAYRGCKVDSMQISSSQDSTLYTLSMEITGAVAQGNQFDGSADPTIGATLGTAPTYTAGPPPTATIYPPAGTNYPINPYLFVHSSTTAAAGTAGGGTAVLGNGTTTGPIDSVASITLTAGSGYLVPPTVTLTSATGHGAIFTAQISAGAISGFTQVDAGSGYSTPPTVVITPGPPVEGLLIGTARTQFQSVQLTITNNLMTRFWANRFVQFSQFCGRTSKLVVQNFYNATPDDRTAYEGISPQAVKFGLNNGTNYVQCIMNANNIIETLEDSLPLADVYTQTITISSHWDPAFTAGYYTGGSFSADAALPADLLLNIN